MNKASLIQQDNLWLIKVHLSIQAESESTIEFLSKSSQLEILSTNYGSIRDNILTIPQGTRFMEVTLLYMPDIDNIECVVCHAAGQFVINVKVPTLNTISIVKPNIKPVNIHQMDTAITIFYEPEWYLKLTNKGHLRIDVVKEGNTSIFVALGDEKQQSAAADFVFSLNKYQSRIIVPKEIMWMKHKSYKGHTIGCYELVKSHASPNILYKVLISNKINITSLLKPKPTKLNLFRLPTGKTFDSTCWTIDRNSYLPVYTQ